MSDTNIETEIQNIENPIKSCTDMEKEHSYSSRRLLGIVLILTMALLTILFLSYVSPSIISAELSYNISDTFLYAF